MARLVSDRDRDYFGRSFLGLFAAEIPCPMRVCPTAAVRTSEPPAPAAVCSFPEALDQGTPVRAEA